MMKKIIYIIVCFVFGMNLLCGQPTMMWDKSYGGSNDDAFLQGQGAIISQDRYLVTVLTTNSNDGDVKGFHGVPGTYQNQDIWVLKIDITSGDTLWTKTLGGTASEYALAVGFYVSYVLEMNDGNYMIVASTGSDDGDVVGYHGGDPTGIYSGDIWLVKLNAITGQIMWSKTYGGSKHEKVQTALLCADGNIFVTGVTNSADGDVDSLFAHAGGIFATDIWTLKINAITGNIMWAKTLGGSKSENPASALESSDGHYVVAGVTYSTDGYIHGSHGGKDVYVVKLEGSSGDTIWTKALGGSEWDEMYTIPLSPWMFQSKDGHYIVMCNTKSSDGDIIGAHGESDIVLFKLDSATGNIIWTRAYGGTAGEIPHHLLEVDDGNILISAFLFGCCSFASFCLSCPPNGNGDISRYNFSPFDSWLIKIDVNDGTIIWDKTFGAYGEDKPSQHRSLSQTCDGGFLLTTMMFRPELGGSTGSQTNPITIIGVLNYNIVYRLDRNGNILWDKVLGMTSAGSGQVSSLGVIWSTARGGYLFTLEGVKGPPIGDRTAPSHGGADYWLAKLDYTLETDFSFSTVCEGDTTFFVDKTITKTEEHFPEPKYFWDFGDSTSDSNNYSQLQSPVHAYSQAGKYKASLIVQKDCKFDTIYYDVTVNEPDTNFLGADTFLCDQNSYYLDAKRLNDYYWSTGETTRDIEVYTSDIYSVIKNDKNGCEAIDTIAVSFFNSPQIDVELDTILCDDPLLVLNAKTINDTFEHDYLWSTGITGEVLNIENPYKEQLYWLIDLNAPCPADTVYLKCQKIYIPNVFSPNGDSDNDVFMARSVGLKDIVVKVYDRWGQQVFESFDKNVGWNGEANGRLTNAGVYIYVITGSFNDGTKIDLKGNVTLVR